MWVGGTKGSLHGVLPPKDSLSLSIRFHYASVFQDLCSLAEILRVTLLGGGYKDRLKGNHNHCLCLNGELEA
jgi:hypothetical protein